MTTRRMTAHDRKTAIVQAALPLFAHKGFAETTTKDLARAAGISEPLLYKHFPSKEALYLEIQDTCRRSPPPGARKLSELKPSTSTLVHLVYFLMRLLVMSQPAGAAGGDVRHRLMLQSLLEDGVFARLLYRRLFDGFASRIDASLKAATVAGDVVRTPVSGRNRARFAHHVGAWLALVNLPSPPAMDYRLSRQELVDQAVWFVLRGMGMTDQALETHYNPQALALCFADDPNG